MKKYQIGNLTVEAESPVKALEIAKLFTKDSNIVDGVEKFYWNDVRQMCIRHNWYTHGTISEYDRMLNAASNGQWTIDEIAFDIANHSDSSVSKNEVLAELKKIKLVDSKTKDSDIEELTEEEKKAIEDYRAAIANTKDPKLLKIFGHILKEEVEHLEELKNKDIEK